MLILDYMIPMQITIGNGLTEKMSNIQIGLTVNQTVYVSSMECFTQNTRMESGMTVLLMAKCLFVK